MARLAGRSIAAALLAACATAATAGDVLTVDAPEGPLLRVPVDDGAAWCLRWQHSVTGGDVADCFVNVAGLMVLDRSYLHDFAAGLGTIQGRGNLRAAAEGGYWIEDMGEPIDDNTLLLRVGRPAVDHRLTIDGEVYDLSQMAAGERVAMRLVPAP